MTDLKDAKQLSENEDSDEENPKGFLPSAAFTAYRSFPPVMNLYGNFSGVVKALRTFKLCGATENEFLYLVEAHYGFTSRGPLCFGPGYYLHNGTSLKSPIRAATGDEYPIPFLAQLFRSKTTVKLPPLEQERNPRDMVTEVVQSTSSKEHGVAFAFEIEVGVERMVREAFEWRKMHGASSSSNDANTNDNNEDGGHSDSGTRYMLCRLAPGQACRSRAEASRFGASGVPTTVEETKVQVVAELRLNNVLNWKHPYTLELKGPGLTGELGERWALMTVVTSLTLYYLRQVGKTNKTTVAAAQKVHSKSS